MSYKVSTTRSISFPNEQPRVYFQRHSGEIDVTASDERVTLTIGGDSLYIGIKQYISGYQYVGADDAAESLSRLRELISLAEAAYGKLETEYGPKIVA